MGRLSFEGRTALVTGAGRNLGRSYALLLAERGAKVVVNDLGVAVSDTDGRGEPPEVNPAHDVVAEIERLGGTAVADTASIADPDDADAIVGSAVANFGGLDILVNNAGVVRRSPIDEMRPELVDPVVSTHLVGTLNMIRAAWRIMRPAGYGRILNVSSGAAIGGLPTLSVYGAAKLAVVGLTRALSLEGRPHGITVNAIAPYASVRGTDFGPVKWTPRLADWLSPDQVAPLVAWLVHQECQLSGECFTVGGGYVGRLALAQNRGWRGRPLTPEKIRDEFAEIMGDDSQFVVSQPGEAGEIARIMQGFTP